MDPFLKTFEEIDLDNHEDYEDIGWLFEENEDCICGSCEGCSQPFESGMF